MLVLVKEEQSMAQRYAHNKENEQASADYERRVFVEGCKGSEDGMKTYEENKENGMTER